MATGVLPQATVEDVLAQLAALEDPRIRAVNERHGDDHGVNLTQLRAVAKSLKTDHELAGRLWATGDTAARLVAILISRPKAYSAAELDAMLRDARVPKVQDWLVSYVVKKSPHVEELRVAWFADPDPVVASAGWALTSDRVAKAPDGLDLDGLLDLVEAADEGRTGPPAVGHERVPRRPSASTTREHPCARDRHRRAARGAQGLPDPARLHVPVRADLDQRDRPPPGRIAPSAPSAR